MFQTGAQVAGQAVQGILERVDALAAKIGTTAQAIWQVYVAQAKVEGIRDFIIAGVFLLSSGIFAKMCHSSWRSFRDLKREFEDPTLAVLLGVAAFCTFGLSLFWSYEAIGEILNPSYWAFQHLTADLKNLF